MGVATRHRQAFLRQHTVCAFCGGKEAATTIEHCPPRAMFQHRAWPEGFEFPSCVLCNHGTDDADALVAMLARMDPFHNNGDQDGKTRGLMAMVNKQYPGMFAKMMPTATEARRNNRELGIKPSPGQSNQEAGVVKVTDEMHQAVCVFGRKLAKAVFYHDVRNVFPNEGCLLMNWFTNADLLREGRYPVFDLLKNVAGNAPALYRTGRYLNDQFEYKLSLSPEQHVFLLQAKFGGAFGLAIFGCTTPGLLEASVLRLREQSEHEGPFAVLQPTSLETAVSQTH